MELQRTRALRNAAPSHSALGTLSDRSARAASRWQERWIKLQAETDLAEEVTQMSESTCFSPQTDAAFARRERAGPLMASRELP
jgi:hypothetical protein